MKPTIRSTYFGLQTFLLVFLLLCTLGINPAVADPLPNDAKITASIDYVADENNAGDTDTYTFTANAGDHIELRMADLETTGLDPYLQLFGPSDGTVLKADTDQTTAVITYTATETGTYTVIAADQKGINTGNYNLYYTKALGANEHGALANDGIYSGQRRAYNAV